MSFPIVGNLKIKNALSNALHEHRLPHAILIEGNIGTGRHTLAEFLAMSAVCDCGNVPCGSCRNCALAKVKNHPDIITVSLEDSKKNIAVSQIRQIRNQAYVRPHMSKRRVFVIDYADTMNEQSQNALLKVLEEPPADAMFILIAETKAALLETIISRCVVLSLSAPQRAEALDYITGTTDFSIDEIENALESAQNNIGKALLILGGKGDTKTVAAATEFLNFFLRKSAFGMLRTTAPFEKNRVEAERFIKDLKICTAKSLRKNATTVNAVLLSGLYQLLCRLEKSLISNINLGLLFCTLVASAQELNQNYN